MRLDRLLREKEPLTDFAIDEAVGDELEDLDLTCRRVLSDLPRRRRGEGDDRAAAARAAPRGGCFEPATVVAVTVQDLPALGGVHESRIGARRVPL